MKIVLSLLLFVNILFANENLKSIYDNIVLNNSNNAVLAAKDLKTSIKATELDKTKVLFAKLVVAWKKVEAFYILGDLNRDYLDTPRYIDIFHHGNEDIKKQLDLILSKKDELKYALYKNSHKSINALEYMLFEKDLKQARVRESALVIIAHMQKKLEAIHEGYIKEEEIFLKDEVTANAMMLHSLIENSYKLKEWRVGDAAGLSRKFKGKPNNERAEYYISQNSLLAIEAIIATHQMILDTQSYKNFGTMIESYGAKEELASARKYLSQALAQSKAIKKDNFLEAKPLFKSLKKLHATYYITLISKLKITAKILDADGD